MNQGRIIVITGAPGTGKTTTASAVAKESDLEKSVHMHTDDFSHFSDDLCDSAVCCLSGDGMRVADEVPHEH